MNNYEWLRKIKDNYEHNEWCIHYTIIFFEKKVIDLEILVLSNIF